MNRSWLRRRREILQAEVIGLASGTKQVFFRGEKEQTEEGVADVASEDGRSRAWDFALSPRIQEPLKGSVLRSVGR